MHESTMTVSAVIAIKALRSGAGTPTKTAVPFTTGAPWPMITRPFDVTKPG
jgi:hypothetical protein